MQKLQEQLDEARKELEQAQRAGNLGRAGELTYGVIPELEAKLKEAEEAKKGALIKEQVTEEDIASVVARWTGIPIENMMQSERDKLLNMEQVLKAQVVGQEEAVKAVSDAVRRSRAGLQDEGRPVGSFLFLGPTGVGKTELSKALARFIFDDEAALLRVDMSEYMEKHAVARLIGAPPGYVGYEEGGVITEAVRRRPYQVILFDEVEKAHPDVFNILLQVLDDGRLTDGQGRTVDFRNTMIILTSNLGSEFLANRDDIDDLVREQVMKVVRSAFRPEFLNRLDDVVVFSRLSRFDMTAVVEIQLHRLLKRLEDKRITVQLEPEAIEWLAEKGYDPVYGARPLKRVIQRELQNKIAEMILRGEVLDGSSINISSANNTLVVTTDAPKRKAA
jgi:ATP-dependent Clp protease ATP-binding subunit ClpB